MNAHGWQCVDAALSLELATRCNWTEGSTLAAAEK